MLEHFQPVNQDDERFTLTSDEQEELTGVVAEVSSVEDLTEGLDPASVQRLVYGIAEMAFIAGRSFQDAQTDEQYVVVRLPVNTAGRFIEMLLEG